MKNTTTEQLRKDALTQFTPRPPIKPKTRKKTHTMQAQPQQQRQLAQPENAPNYFANRKFPNTGGWQDRHDEAMVRPREGFEHAMAYMLRGWKAYADTVKANFDSQIGSDYVLGPEWQKIGEGIEGLLDGSCGRLDCGTLDGFIRDTLKHNGCEIQD